MALLRYTNNIATLPIVPSAAMSHNTSRRLFVGLVAVLVVCSLAGAPAFAVAASGTVGDDDDSLGPGDESSGPSSSDDNATDDNSSQRSSNNSSEDSNSNSTEGSSDDGSSDTQSEDKSTSNESADNSTDSQSTDDSADNATANATWDVVDQVNETGEAVDETADGVEESVDETVDGTTSATYAIVESAGDAGLGDTLGLSEDDPQQAGPDRGQAPGATERLGPSAADSGDGTAGVSGSTDGSARTVDEGPDGAAGADAGDDDGNDGSLPSGVSGGATVGLGALAAIAVARSAPLAEAAGSGSLSTLFDRIRPFVFPLRYSRYDDSDPLEHDARELVYEIVNETPGSYLSEVSEQADLPLSTTRHHMKVLEREELVSGAKLRGKRRFYPAYAEGVELAAALNDESTASIIDALTRLGAASVSDLADDIGRDPSTISHHLQRLAEDEIITREREGRAVMNKLSSEARTALEPETTPRPGEAAEALAD
jgi:DNA-binding transcriptional ArsR family regulator